MTYRASEFTLRAALVLGGAHILYTGANIAFGGIPTLGLQGATDFMTITNEPVFLAHDSHVRFLGGLWMGVGVLFLAGAARLFAMRQILKAAYALIFLGGLARLSALDPALFRTGEIGGALTAELVLMPALYFWTASVRPTLKAEQAQMNAACP